VTSRRWAWTRDLAPAGPHATTVLVRAEGMGATIGARSCFPGETRRGGRCWILRSTGGLQCSAGSGGWWAVGGGGRWVAQLASTRARSVGPPKRTRARWVLSRPLTMLARVWWSSTQSRQWIVSSWAR
jgi:hypothetical protein